MVSRPIFDIRADYVERVVKTSAYSEFQVGQCSFAPIYLKISTKEGEIFSSFLILRAMLQCCRGRFLIRAKLKGRHIADFQGGKCTFAPIYIKISTKEGGTFLEFLILGTMSTMVCRPIFDIRADYVERVVKIFRHIAKFQVGQCSFAPIYLKISTKEGEIFSSFLILGAMSTMVPRPILIRANLKDRHKADFQDGKCSFAPIYLKISMTEGGTFLEFLILMAMSTMLPGPILIRAKLKGRQIADFQGGKRTFAPIYLKIL